MQRKSTLVAPSEATDEERRKFLTEANCIELLEPGESLWRHGLLYGRSIGGSTPLRPRWSYVRENETDEDCGHDDVYVR